MKCLFHYFDKFNIVQNMYTEWSFHLLQNGGGDLYCRCIKKLKKFHMQAPYLESYCSIVSASLKFWIHMNQCSWRHRSGGRARSFMWSNITFPSACCMESYCVVEYTKATQKKTVQFNQNLIRWYNDGLKELEEFTVVCVPLSTKCLQIGTYQKIPYSNKTMPFWQWFQSLTSGVCVPRQMPRIRLQSNLWIYWWFAKVFLSEEHLCRLWHLSNRAC